MNKSGQLVSTTVTSNFEQFNQAVVNTFCPMICEQIGAEQPFQAELLDTRLDRIHLSRISTSPLRVQRRKADIAQVAGDSTYIVKFQIAGEGLVLHRGHEAHLQQGDFVMCTTSEPYQLRFPNHYQQATLAIPHTVLNTMFKMPEDYLGIKMCGQSPVHGLLSQFINSLIGRIDQLEPQIVQRLEANILDLLVTSLHSESRQKNDKTLDRPANQLDDIKRFISLNLRDYQLSVDLIANAHGISKRYLHLLFKPEGISVSRYIQKQRLAACHRALLNGDMQHLSTTEIALEFGFGDLSHFYRCFKAQFDITPGQLRDQINHSN
ncbi:MAG: helix-turn-helix domain-containing protein [Pseudomonadales bacterium]